jgi:pantetheine-phosphate adenylyltransferase
MKVTAIYPGTFDPITNGHTDIVMRATCLFDNVIVAVAGSTSKKTVFSLDERVKMASKVLGDIENVEVSSFEGLVTDYAKSRDAGVIIRGLRAVSDFEYEFQMASMNRQLYAKTETAFLTPAEQFSYISSSLVREVASLGGDVSPFVHKDVMQALKKRLNG